MNIEIHPHALQRMKERGVNEVEVFAAIEKGEKLSAKHGRTCFRSNFVFGKQWQNKHYSMKQVEVYAVIENNKWLVITIIAKYY